MHIETMDKNIIGMMKIGQFEIEILVAIKKGSQLLSCLFIVFVVKKKLPRIFCQQ